MRWLIGLANFSSGDLEMLARRLLLRLVAPVAAVALAVHLICF